jgi:hypothetical protein
MDVGDRIGQHQTAYLAVGRPMVLDVVVRRAAQPDDPARDSFGIAQVVQPSDNLELPFGSAAPSVKSALAALTSFSSASSSMMRRRAACNGTAS